jgi:hypothetical protein
MNLGLSDTELKYYKQWVELTQKGGIQEYETERIRQKLQSLRKQDGYCGQRVPILQKGEYKGSCSWSSRANSYKICVRTSEKTITYGFFSNLYSAEMELRRLFKNDEEELWDVARKQQKYYQLQHRLTTRPRLTDKTKNISNIFKKKGAILLVFSVPFVNPISSKKQKTIKWGESWFKYFSKKQIIDECVKLDDGAEIIQYREDLRQRRKKYLASKKKETQLGDNTDD